MITLFIDIALLGTIVFCTWRGYKNGLIRGVFGVVALILSLFIANAAAKAYADEAKGMLLPFVSGVVESTITDMVEQGIEYQALAHDHKIDDLDFGTAYTALRQIGLPESAAVSIAEQALEALEDGIPDGVEKAVFDIVADKLSSALSFVAVFGIAFLLIAIIFAVIGNLVGLVFELPGLKLVDIISGSVFGLLKGLIIVYSVAVIARYFGLLSPATFEKAIVLRYFINNNPIASILGI